MTVEEKMYAIMSGAAGITVHVPASRIKPWSGIYQNLLRPYILHKPIALDPTYTHEGMAALRIWRFYQVSIVTDLHPLPGVTQAAIIREAVVLALNGYRDAYVNRIAFLTPGPGSEDTDKQIQQTDLNFYVAEALTAQ